MVPDDTTIAFHVTSLDVIHSFWAYQLGVKADANPAYGQRGLHDAQQHGHFTVRCAELCGLWHGAMYNIGQVVSDDQFEAWATATETAAGRQHQAAAAVRLHLRRPTPTAPTAGYYPDNVDPTPTSRPTGPHPAKPTRNG